MNPAILTAIIVAVISVLGSVGVALMRKPVSVQDLWSENRGLRADLKALDEKVSEIEEKYDLRDRARLRQIGALGAGVEVLWHFIERLRDEWGDSKPFPPFSEEEKNTIDRARDVRAATAL